jgi:hypothetical protein
MGLFFDITLGLLAVTEGADYFRKCCTISQPVARHTASCEQMYSSAASSAPIRCGWPVTNGCTAIAMTRGTVSPSRYSVSNEKTQLQLQAHATQYVARAVADRNPTAVAILE